MGSGLCHSISSVSSFPYCHCTHFVPLVNPHLLILISCIPLLFNLPHILNPYHVAYTFIPSIMSWSTLALLGTFSTWLACRSATVLYIDAISADVYKRCTLKKPLRLTVWLTYSSHQPRSITPKSWKSNSTSHYCAFTLPGRLYY